MMADPLPRVAFSWNGLPQYAARQIRAAMDQLGEQCIVVGSKPSVPVKGIEEALSCPICWVDANLPVTWAALGHEVPQIFVQSGWGYPAFNALGAEVKQRGGVVIGLSDNNWRNDFRQRVIGALGFRLLHRKRFDAMVVPGAQGRKLMRWFGMRDEQLRGGMYGADSTLFHGGAPLAFRPKTFLFVGQFIARKDVLGLANAFIRFSAAHPDWKLHLCGSGAQRHLIPPHERIVVEGFVQPAQLAERFRQARFLVLPSLSEAWGLVVHEAASCGCGLILSDKIGSADDLATARNGVSFRAGNGDDLARALSTAAQWDGAALLAAERESRALAEQFGPQRFSQEIAGLVQSFATRAQESTRAIRSRA